MALLLAMAAIKLAIVALVVAGLVFRTQVTIGLVAILNLLALIAARPVIGLTVLTALIAIGVIFKVREANAVRITDEQE